jgi:hypothetical protein
VPYVVRKGVPEILELWKRLLKEYRLGVISADDRTLFKKWLKAIGQLRDNPKHPGLKSHEIGDLTKRYGQKVFQSYLENSTPAQEECSGCTDRRMGTSLSLASNHIRRIRRKRGARAYGYPSCRRLIRPSAPWDHGCDGADMGSGHRTDACGNRQMGLASDSHLLSHFALPSSSISHFHIHPASDYIRAHGGAALAQ